MPVRLEAPALAPDFFRLDGRDLPERPLFGLATALPPFLDLAPGLGLARRFGFGVSSPSDCCLAFGCWTASFLEPASWPERFRERGFDGRPRCLSRSTSASSQPGGVQSCSFALDRRGSFEPDRRESEFDLERDGESPEGRDRWPRPLDSWRALSLEPFLELFLELELL